MPDDPCHLALDQIGTSSSHRQHRELTTWVDDVYLLNASTVKGDNSI